MSRYLLDTFAVIALLTRPSDLSPSVLDTLADPHSDVAFSPVSIWEIEIKASIGKLAPPRSDVAEALRALGYQEIAITSAHAVRAGRFPLHHRDPFDRMLIAQAAHDGRTLVSPDRMLAVYPVDVLVC